MGMLKKNEVPAGKRLTKEKFKAIQKKLDITNAALARLTGRNLKTVELARASRSKGAGEGKQKVALISASFSNQMLLFRYLAEKEPAAWKRLLKDMLGE